MRIFPVFLIVFLLSFVFAVRSLLNCFDCCPSYCSKISGTAVPCVVLMMTLMTHSKLHSSFFGHDECNWEVDYNSPLCHKASMEAITTMAQVLRNSTVTPEILPFNPYKKATMECDVTIIGKDYSSHQLCKSLLRAPNSPETSIAQEPCLFYSYGIQNDYTFDTELSNQYDCFGFLFDPSVSHNSHPGQKLLFMGLGAPMLHHDNFENPGV